MTIFDFHGAFLYLHNRNYHINKSFQVCTNTHEYKSGDSGLCVVVVSGLDTVVSMFEVIERSLPT